ncbi:hypothetical protein PWT90_03608 [Aphanocladium album]|nr:hypothetical protein PWT90_03608 [Aphanocladium album]
MFEAASLTVTSIQKTAYTAEAQGSAFNLRFSMSPYTWYAEKPERAARFASAMAGCVQMNPDTEELAEKFPWARLGDKKVIDVGGESGHISIHLATNFLSLRFLVQDINTIMLEQGPKRHDYPPVQDRVSFMQYSFFEPQPNTNAGLFFLREVVHNYPDEVCVKIFKSFVPAMEKSAPGTSLLINGMLLPPPNQELKTLGSTLFMYTEKAVTLDLDYSFFCTTTSGARALNASHRKKPEVISTAVENAGSRLPLPDVVQVKSATIYERRLFRLGAMLKKEVCPARVFVWADPQPHRPLHFTVFTKRASGLLTTKGDSRLRKKGLDHPSRSRHYETCQRQCQAAAVLSMASVTRSTRRPEGFPPPHINGHAPMARATPALFHHPPPQQQPQARRTKRGIEPVEHDFATANTKKTRITVEILSRPAAAPHKVQAPPLPQPPPQQPRPVPVAAAPAAAAAASHRPGLPPPEADPNVTKHQAKVINGIKHELDRLQPDMAATKEPGREPGRKLRSQEATRFKSDLSAYFPDYDEVIGNEPKEQHLLNPDTPIIVVDSSSRRVPQSGFSQPQPEVFPVRGYGDALYTDVFDAQQIDFGFLEAQYKNKVLEDPLPDSTFEPVHKRAERLERSIRNTEKGRAQHEKDQIIRLLEGLQGHDWLRVMGVSGITETKKKMFEPARAHFIRGCQGILDKFKNWSLEEKRRKLERERTLAEQAQEELKETEEAEADAEDEEMEDAGSTTPTHQSRSEDGDVIEEEDEDVLMNSQDNSSEASSSSPAKQLRQEAMARSKIAASKRPRSDSGSSTPRQSETPKEFRSFFSKRYERDGALNKHRRAGRNVLAWGHPIPDIAEMDFDLPEDYRDDELLKARARKRRRDKRAKP